MFHFTALPPLALYVHFPWCARKCPYCDFNSHAVVGEVPQARYVDALLADLEQDLPRVWGRRVETIYLGGGTPSLFSPQALERLLAGVRARLPLQPEAEVTLEANPGTVDQARFEGYREAGVNRLSLGVQSFDDGKLRLLGRIHDSREARAAARGARAAGFDNLNLDLMFGLPGQTAAQALEDLGAALELQPAHLSLYQLTIEPGTRFFRRPPALPDEGVTWDMQQALGHALAERAYVHYEVSAYARPGRCCRHNLNYWRFGDYLGIGAGAHSKISEPGGVSRMWKIRHPRRFMEAAGTPDAVGGEKRLDPDEVVLEFMMNTLRINAGFSLGLFARHTGLAGAVAEAPLHRAEREGLITRHGDRVRTTALGARYLNNLLELFVPDRQDSRPGGLYSRGRPIT